MSRFTLRKLLPVAVFAALAIPAAVVTVPALADDTGEKSNTSAAAEDDTRIVGGGTVPSDQRKPWIVALYGSKGGFCTATQISRNYVLTAAHCVKGGDTYTARIGSLNRTSGGKVIAISSVKKHPKYKTNKAYDIAVLKLKTPYTNTYARPAFAKKHLKLGQATLNFGWGSTKTDWSGPLPKNLKYSKGKNTTKWCNRPEHLCTIGSGAVAGGDSGGPLFVKSAATGKYILVGACALGHKPATHKWAAYSSTVHNSKWIAANTDL